MNVSVSPSFIDALRTNHPAPDRADKMNLYGWLIGRWEMETTVYADDGTKHAGRGEIHAGWVLEGRAVQDVWIMPRRTERTTELGKANNMYGTTLRVWDSAIQAWRVTWINPVTGARDELIGRRSGNDIVQVGTHPDGTPIRWIFSEIAEDSFRWTGEALNPDGKTWKLEGEFRAKRAAEK